LVSVLASQISLKPTFENLSLAERESEMYKSSRAYSDHQTNILNAFTLSAISRLLSAL